MKLEQARLHPQVPHRPLGAHRPRPGEDLHGKTRFREAGHHRGPATHAPQPHPKADPAAEGAGQPVGEAGQVVHLTDHVEVARRYVQP